MKLLKMKKLFIAILTLLSMSAEGYSTEQSHDILIYKNKTTSLFALPLRSYFKEKDTPNFMIKPRTLSTSNWRGYIATWEIIDDTLYLTNIDSYICPSPEGECHRATLELLFREKCIDGKVKAVWFTGDLPIPDGKILKQKNVIGIAYEREIVIKIESGKVIGTTTIENRKRRKN